MFGSGTKTQDKLFFIHIPKTAGTSFRAELEGVSRSVLKDYGADNRATSDIVKTWAYDQNDFSKLKDLFIEGRYKALCGHIAINKYLNFVPVQNIVTFMRAPVSRVVSNYNHDTTHNGLVCSFNDYINENKFQNIQSKLLNSMPLEMLGFVGLTEQYAESLELINQLFSRRLKVKQRNRSNNPNINLSQLEPELLARIEQVNDADIRLYSQAKNLFERRKIFSQSHDMAQWVYSDVTTVNDCTLTGCAFRGNSSAPVELVLKIDGKACKEVLAKSFYTGFVKAQFPRNRYVSFDLSLDTMQLNSQLITLEVAGTGQVIYSNTK